MKIVLATKNRGKAEEMKKILKGLEVELFTLEDFPPMELPPEHGSTFTENALVKARFVASRTNTISLADDSGLEVDALGGSPGIYSARYAGENASDEDNNKKLLGELKGLPPEKRTARFKCVISLVSPEGTEVTFEGSFEGVIADAPKGENGFGYDPLFFIPSEGKTSAELPSEKKNEISHRGQALKKMQIWLENHKNF
ncbi:MAG: XTP/dITP diphosphatase [Deltaproteobacteria bacterium]|nr:XTP/dITP diphosphatase [Deltaproteobacteria bacterium]